MPMWYYTENEQPVGPFEAQEIRRRVSNGTLLSSTFVWREGLPNWVALGEVEELRSPAQPATYAPVATPASVPEQSPYAPRALVAVPVSPYTSEAARTAQINAQLGQEPSASPVRADASELPTYVCCECGTIHAVNMMVYLEGRWVCATCKPVYLQKLEERYFDRKGLCYAAFTTRFHSGFFDYFLLQMFTLAMLFVSILIPALFTPLMPSYDAGITVAFAMGGGIAIAFLFRFLYEACWIGYKGSTPGQTVWGLRVVKTDGQSLTVGESFLRSLANLLNYVTLGLGYCTVLFDDEKRSLTDIICGTRVICCRK